MPDYDARMDTTVRGNALDVTRTVSVVPAGASLADGYFTLYDPSGVTPLFEKHITGTPVSGEGEIEDDGSVDGVAIITFQLTAANLLLCTGGTFEEPALHPYGIEVRTDGGQPYEFEQGVLPIIEERVVAA